VGLLIDTSVFIQYERGNIGPDAWLVSPENEEMFVSVISQSELLHGVHRATDPAVRARRSAFVESILERFVILPIESATARTHAQLWAEMTKMGTLISQPDLWIAATAMTNGLVMVTANVKDFARVPGLRVERRG
jgi:tRNA(fMet)-specific endonuclease VapC